MKQYILKLNHFIILDLSILITATTINIFSLTSNLFIFPIGYLLIIFSFIYKSNALKNNLLGLFLSPIYSIILFFNTIIFSILLSGQVYGGIAIINFIIYAIKVVHYVKNVDKGMIGKKRDKPSK